jgi:hypothetical protein
MATKLDTEVLTMFKFLRSHPLVRQRLCAPADKTVVYSGGIQRSNADNPNVTDYFAAWKQLAQAKKQNPQKFDYITLEERLRQFHVIEFGETLFEHANRITDSLKSRGRADQAVYLWRALSGIYVQGARGKVRALILPGDNIGQSVFSLTEAKVLLRQDVLQRIEMDPNLIREFQLMVKTGLTPRPIVIF